MDLINRLRSHRWQKSAKEIFKIVYGRDPFANEMPHIAHAANELRKGNQHGAFRRVINGCDHQTLQTAFTVRFLSEDIDYIMLDGIYLALDKADPSISQPVLAGQYEPHLLTFYRERLKSGMVFVDVGANIGLYSILAAQIVGEQGRVLCFEPNSDNCRLILLSAYKNNITNTTVFPLALGNEMGHALFTTAIGSNGGLISKTIDSLLRPSCTVVPMARLDDILHERVDMLKMDVEGAEGLVIKGAKQVIEKYRPVVTSEFSLEMLPRVSRISGNDYLQYFKSIRYDLYYIDRETYKLVDINDIDMFISNYGEPVRIEDLALIPR